MTHKLNAVTMEEAMPILIVDRLFRGNAMFSMKEYANSPVCLNVVPEAWNVIVSLTKAGDHLPMLDIDSLEQLERIPARTYHNVEPHRWHAVPSTTPGHFHAINTEAVSWQEYAAFLHEAIARQFCDPSWAAISLQRGYGVLRKPGTNKHLPVPLNEMVYGVEETFDLTDLPI
jgi:hypothetical protein